MMFASKTPRDLNHDPEPWVYEIAGNGFRSHIPFTSPGDLRVMDWVWAPRPEFDHVQHNEPNPILVEFRGTLRNYDNKSLCLSHYVEYVTYGQVYGWAAAHIDHARKVLTRLARLDTEALSH